MTKTLRSKDTAARVGYIQLVNSFALLEGLLLLLLEPETNVRIGPGEFLSWGTDGDRTHPDTTKSHNLIGAC